MYGTVANFLKDKIQDSASLSFVSAYFTINAFNALRDSLTGIDNLRFLFGEPDVISGMDPSKIESKAFRLTEEGLGLRSELSQNEIAKACADWIEKKVTIKSVRKTNFLHGKMYYIENGDREDAIIGSSNFTVRGLGLSKNASNIELNLEVDSKSDCADLKIWFDNLWESDQVVDVTDEVLQNLANAYQDKDPEFIYYKTLYHLFEDFLKDATDTEFAQANPKFQETEIWQKLFDFQKHGVQACIQKLKAYNGCIIADSVGLGKTYEALAIIKYFELRNADVLVLCPKKLEHNWTLYPTHYRNKHNPFKKDSFRYNVRAHTDLTDQGPSNFDWDAFDLVVIDESHNFRNRPTNKYGEDGNLIRKSRYNRLLEDIIQSGCKTQVLMLSATPVNNRLTDLENQIRLITEDRDDAFYQTGIPSIGGTLNTAQGRFEKWTDKKRIPLIKAIAGGIQTIRIRDKDILEPAQIKEGIQKGIRTLTRREIENYLLADEVLIKLCQDKDKSNKTDELLAAKHNLKKKVLKSDSEEDKPDDKLKCIAADFYERTKDILDLQSEYTGKEPERDFMKCELAPLIQPDMAVYTELHKVIFGE